MTPADKIIPADQLGNCSKAPTFTPQYDLNTPEHT
jgi:hypothetical protein